MIPFSAFVIFFLFFSSSGSTDTQSPAPHIVGGVDTEISQVPYHAALLLGDYYFCGASIVSAKFLITAAHCILFFYQLFDSDDGLIVRLGSNYSEKGGTTYNIVNTTCHKDFDFDNYDYDICLMEVEKPINFTKTIRSIKLGEKEPKSGDLALIAGWGALWEGGSQPEKLQSVVVPVTNRTYCVQAYEKFGGVTERMICAGETGKDSCQGDSGGGLVVNGSLLGVVSNGYGCGNEGYPGVYTSVAHPEIRKFIKEVTGL